MSVRPPLHAFVAPALFAACLSSTARLPVRADSLSPLVTGAVIDLGKNGTPDSLDDYPFIANNPTNQYRAIVEYDLSSVPQGTVLSASLTGRVGANNSLNTGTREHRVDVYSGNGSVNLADYTTAGALAGTFSHPSGGTSNYNFDITSILQNLLNTGATHLGMRISPVSANMAFDVLYESFPTPLLNFTVQPAGSQTKSILPTFDARVSRSGTTYNLTTADTGINVQKVDFASVDRRGVLEYYIGAVPDDAIISDAKIVYQVNVITSGSTTSPQPVLYGYAGNGTAEVADGFETGRQIGVSDPVAGLGPVTIDIDHTYVQSLLATSNYLGVAMVGALNSQQFGFASLEYGPSLAPATLMLSYTLPPIPGDFNEDAAVNAADLVEWRGAFGSGDGGDADDDGDTDGADLLLWQRNVGRSTASAAGHPVPEPSVAMLAFVALATVRMGGRASARIRTAAKHSLSIAS